MNQQRLELIQGRRRVLDTRQQGHHHLAITGHAAPWDDLRLGKEEPLEQIGAHLPRPLILGLGLHMLGNHLGPLLMGLSDGIAQLGLA